MFEATKKLSGGDLKFLNRARNLTILEMCFEGAPLVVLFFVLKDLFNDSLSRENILLFTLFLGVAVIFRVLFAMYAYIDNSISGVELTCSTRVKLGEKLRKLPMGFFARRDIGELNNTVLFDVTKVEHVITHIYSKLIGCMVLSTITAIFLLFIDWRLALAMLVAVPIALPMLLWAEKTVAARTDRVLDAQENTTSQVLEYLMGMKVIKSFNQIGEKFRRLDGSMRKLKDAAIKLEFGVGKGVVSYSAILEVGFVFLILLGTYLTFDGALKTEIFLIFLVISLYFYAPLRSIGVFFPELRYMEKAGGRINKVLEEGFNLSIWGKIVCAPKYLSEYILKSHTYTSAINEQHSIVVQSSLINLGIDQNPSVYKSHSARLYRVMCASGLYLVNGTKGLDEIFVVNKPGESITRNQQLVFYYSEDDLIEKLDFLLDHPKMCKQIAENGRLTVLERDTFKHRIQEMLEIIKK